MCVKLVKKVLKTNIDTTPKMILTVLCEAAESDGSCFPSNKLLAGKASVHLNTVKLWIRAFKSIGLIERTQRKRSNGSDTSVTTKINISVLETLTKEQLKKAKSGIQKNRKSSKGDANVPQYIGSTPVHQEYPHPSTATVPPKEVHQEYPPYQSVLPVNNEQSESSNNYQDLNNSREEKKSNTLPIESNSGVSDDDSQTNNFSCQSIEETNICKGVEQKEKTTKEMPRPELPTDKLTREHFWIYRADYDVLKADYSQNDIDLYIQKYNNQVTKSGKAYPSPVGTIREWMLSDKIPKKKVYDPEWDKIMFQANFPRFEWETDEGYEERMKRFVKAGLHHHHDGNIRKWLNDDAVEIARQITSEVRGEYGYQ